MIDATDFVFKAGNNNSPNLWAAVTATPTISVRAGAGTGGSDRVTITWASGSISNKWLEVQVLPTAHTGLTTTDVFFWGNKVGDTGQATPPTTFLTSGVDKSSVLGSLGPAGGVTKIQDFNRDGTVSGVDASVAIGSLGSIVRIKILPPDRLLRKETAAAAETRAWPRHWRPPAPVPRRQLCRRAWHGVWQMWT